VTVEQAEADHIVRNEGLGTEPIPFGFDNGSWRKLVTQMQQGDELWQFVSSYDSWKNYAGTAGYELVRNGETVATIITLRN
jgi:hypothetical protein